MNENIIWVEPFEEHKFIAPKDGGYNEQRGHGGIYETPDGKKALIKQDTDEQGNLRISKVIGEVITGRLLAKFMQKAFPEDPNVLERVAKVSWIKPINGQPGDVYVKSVYLEGYKNDLWIEAYAAYYKELYESQINERRASECIVLRNKALDLYSTRLEKLQDEKDDIRRENLEDKGYSLKLIQRPVGSQAFQIDENPDAYWFRQNRIDRGNLNLYWDATEEKLGCFVRTSNDTIEKISLENLTDETTLEKIKAALEDSSKVLGYKETNSLFKVTSNVNPDYKQKKLDQIKLEIKDIKKKKAKLGIYRRNEEPGYRFLSQNLDEIIKLKIADQKASYPTGHPSGARLDPIGLLNWEPRMVVSKYLRNNPQLKTDFVNQVVPRGLLGDLAVHNANSGIQNGRVGALDFGGGGFCLAGLFDPLDQNASGYSWLEQYKAHLLEYDLDITHSVEMANAFIRIGMLSGEEVEAWINEAIDLEEMRNFFTIENLKEYCQRMAIEEQHYSQMNSVDELVNLIKDTYKVALPSRQLKSKELGFQLLLENAFELDGIKRFSFFNSEKFLEIVQKLSLEEKREFGIYCETEIKNISFKKAWNPITKYFYLKEIQKAAIQVLEKENLYQEPALLTGLRKILENPKYWGEKTTVPELPTTVQEMLHVLNHRTLLGPKGQLQKIKAIAAAALQDSNLRHPDTGRIYELIVQMAPDQLDHVNQNDLLLLFQAFGENPENEELNDHSFKALTQFVNSTSTPHIKLEFKKQGILLNGELSKVQKIKRLFEITTQQLQIERAHELASPIPMPSVIRHIDDDLEKLREFLVDEEVDFNNLDAEINSVEKIFELSKLLNRKTSIEDLRQCIKLLPQDALCIAGEWNPSLGVELFAQVINALNNIPKDVNNPVLNDYVAKLLEEANKRINSNLSEKDAKLLYQALSAAYGRIKNLRRNGEAYQAILEEITHNIQDAPWLRIVGYILVGILAVALLAVAAIIIAALLNPAGLVLGISSAAILTTIGSVFAELIAFITTITTAASSFLTTTFGSAALVSAAVVTVADTTAGIIAASTVGALGLSGAVGVSFFAIRDRNEKKSMEQVEECLHQIDGRVPVQMVN